MKTKIKKSLLIYCLLILNVSVFASESSERKYDFSLFDGTLDSFTMRQMKENYMSVQRIAVDSINELCGEKTFIKIKVSDWINYLWPSLTMAVTHEEGHRSILTANHIGSISQPFFNGHGAAYVKGVTNQTLIDFRDSDKPSFIRMYLGGMESDYLMLRESEKMAAFGFDTKEVLYPDFIFRTLSITGYLETGFIYHAAETQSFYKWYWKTFYGLKEEPNELERDICGLDPFGATKALFEDNYDFHRYETPENFTEEEKDFITYRVGYRSYLNVLNPFLFMKENFRITDDFYLTGNMGYFMVPFGDSIEENLYLQYKGFSLSNLNFHFYARQNENYKTWFPSFGLELFEFNPLSWLSISTGVHIWWQPEDLSFYATDSFVGGAFEIKTRFMLPSSFEGKTHYVKNWGITAGILYKSAGYMPGIEQHKSHFRFSLGLSMEF